MLQFDRVAPLWLLNQARGHLKTGSRAICTPEPTESDHDFAVLVNDMATVAERLERNGWTPESAKYAGTSFLSMRKREVNLILMDDFFIFNRWKVATHAASRVNACDREYRINIFRAILYPPPVRCDRTLEGALAISELFSREFE